MFLIPLSMPLLAGWTFVGSICIREWNFIPDREREIVLKVLTDGFMEFSFCKDADVKGIPFGDDIYFYAKCTRYKGGSIYG